MAEKVDGCCLSAPGEHSHKEVVVTSDLRVVVSHLSGGLVVFQDILINLAIVGE